MLAQGAYVKLALDLSENNGVVHFKRGDWRGDQNVNGY